MHTSMPHQRRVRWLTNATRPSSGRLPRHASTNSASSIHDKMHEQDVQTRWWLAAPKQNPFSLHFTTTALRLEDHRLGPLKYCAVGLGFSRLMVGLVSSSLLPCGHLLCVKHMCPVVGCLWQRLLSVYFDLSSRGGFDNLYFIHGDVLDIRICCLSWSLSLIHRST